MAAIENLHFFLEKIEQQSELGFSEKQLEDLGNDLIQAAQERAGYEELVWQVGAYLLVYTDFDEGFYRRFGYQVVANALYATFVNADFPLGLGFIVDDFLPQTQPSSDRLSKLSEHPTIREVMRALSHKQFKVPVQNFARATAKLRGASVEFLRHGQDLGLPAGRSLHITSALFQATRAQSQENEIATFLLLDVLVTEQKDVNLFYCWLASLGVHASLTTEAQYISMLSRIINMARTFARVSPYYRSSMK